MSSEFDHPLNGSSDVQNSEIHNRVKDLVRVHTELLLGFSDCYSLPEACQLGRNKMLGIRTYFSMHTRHDL